MTTTASMTAIMAMAKVRRLVSACMEVAVAWVVVAASVVSTVSVGRSVMVAVM